MDATTMKHHIQIILHQHRDQLDALTPKTVRFELEQRMGMQRDALEAQKKEIAATIKTCLAQQQDEDDEEQQPVKSEPASFSSMSSAPAAAAASSSSGGAGKLAAQKQLNANKRRALDAAAGDNDVDEDGQRAPPSSAKRQRGDEGADSGDANSVQLGQNKRIEVRSFKNMVLIDIREMYIDKTSGEERPGKKGISLKPEQWAKLIKNADKINEAIQRLEK